MDARASDVLYAVMHGEAEFGINFIGMHEPEIEFERLFDEPYIMICRRDDPLAERTQIEWADLKNRHLIGGWKGGANRLVIDLALAGVAPRWACEVRRLETIPPLVDGGLGIAVIPRFLGPDIAHPTLVGIPLVEPVVVRTLGLLRKRGRSLSPAGRELYDLIGNARIQAHSLAV